jgi:tetratricopeptide (TPR) repeat protein
VQNPFAHGNSRDRSRPFIVVVIILLGLLVSGAFVVRPAWRALKERRAIDFVAKARSAMAANKYAEAKANLVAAYEMAPFHPEVFRVAAEHYTRLGRPYGLQVWEQLEATGAMTLQDRLKWAGLAIACRSYDSARTALQPFAISQSTDPDAIKLLSELYLAGGQADAAHRAAQTAWQLDPKRNDLLLHLGKVELASNDPAIAHDGESKLISLLVSRESISGSAAMVLLNPTFARKISTRLVHRLIAALPDGDLAVELPKLVVQCRESSPAEAGELLVKFMSRNHLHPDDPGFMATVLGLLALQEYRQVQQLVTEDLSVGAEDLNSIRLEASFRLGDWAAVESLLNRKNVRVSKPLETTYRAMLAHAHGNTNELPKLWRAAIAASQRSPELLEVVAERAEYTGAMGQAVQAWREMLAFPDSTARAAAEILRLTEQSHDLEAAYHALRRLSAQRPADHHLRLKVAFHQLLLDVEGESARGVLAQGEAHFPDQNLFHITAALAALRDQQPDLALQWIDRMLMTDPEPDVWKAVRVAALGMSGQSSKAREVARSLNPDSLSAPEHALVKDWLR